MTSSSGAYEPLRCEHGFTAHESCAACEGHDDQCEAEFIPEACAWTPCRCDERASAPKEAS